MANINLRNLTIGFTWMIVIAMVVLAGNSGSEARKRKRRHRGRGGKRRDQRFGPPTSVMDALMKKKSHRASGADVDPSKPPQWTDAHLKAHTKSDFTDQVLRTTGKFGFHSPTKLVRGRVVHVADPGLSSNFGCAHGIRNRDEIPSDEPWIALIKRGRCYFFNKIKLGEKNNASAVVIYDDQEGKIQVMNTIGTKIVSLMVDLQFGTKLAKLTDTSNEPVYLTIEVGKTHEQRINDVTTSPKTPTPRTHGDSLIVHTSILGDPTVSPSPQLGGTGSGSRVSFNPLLITLLVAIVTAFQKR